MVVAGERKSLDEIELIGQRCALQIPSWHALGLSIITLNEERALKLREEINEWLSDKRKEKIAIKNGQETLSFDRSSWISARKDRSIPPT